MSKLLIGADPELFVKQNNKFISAHGLIPGNKYQPFFVEDGAVQVDGMALEFNVEPSDCASAFANRVNSLLKTLRNMIPDNIELVISPIASFDKEYMKGLPREATVLGCLPDFNAYTGKVNPPPEESGRLRTAAGHVHIGWTEDKNPMDKDHFKLCRDVAIELDWILGIPSLLYDKEPGSKIRRKMYGKAGAFRPKPYGMEYRVLSNYWILKKEDMIVVYKNAMTAYRNVIAKRSCADMIFARSNRDKFSAQKIINQNDVKTAQKLFPLLKIYQYSWNSIGGDYED